jgi:hypothetical protein
VQIGFLTIICCFAFFCRSFLIATGFFWWTTQESIFIATCVYLLLFETFPEILILVVMGWKYKKPNNLHKNNDLITVSDNIITVSSEKTGLLAENIR